MSRRTRTSSQHLLTTTAIGALIVVVFAVFAIVFLKNPHERGNQAAWFGGILVALTLATNLALSHRDTVRQNDEREDREASLARTVTTQATAEPLTYYNEERDASEWHVEPSPSCELVIVVAVTNHGPEPIFSPTLIGVQASGPTTSGTLQLGALPDGSRVAPDEVGSAAFYTWVQHDRPIPVLAPGKSVHYAGLYMTAHEQSMPGPSMPDVDARTLSATVTFDDGRGLHWERESTQPPTRIVAAEGSTTSRRPNLDF